MNTYGPLKEWFLDSLKTLKKDFFILIKKVAAKNGVDAEDIFLILQDENLWPILSQDLYRSLTLIQELILWTRVPTLQHKKIDVSKISPIIYELAMTLHLKIFSKMESELDRFVDTLAIQNRESFLSILEDFEKRLVRDRFMKREIILGIINTQFKTLRF